MHGAPCDGRSPDFQSKIDPRGRELGVARYVVYYYNDPDMPTDLSACRSRVAIIFRAASCAASDDGLRAITDSVAAAGVSSTTSNPWTVSAELAGSRLELRRDLNRDIYYRRVNGVDLVTAAFSLNGVDQTGLLGP